MIFLKKILSAAAFFTAVCLIVCGCSQKTGKNVQSDKVETTSQPFTERKVDTAEGAYVFDKAALMSAEDAKACNDYAGWLYNEKLINAAVITVNDLEGKAPYDFAAEAFDDIYEGKGSGLIVLINNDTNIDVVYKTGSCFASIGEKAEENALYWATKEMVSGDVRKGVMRLLQLGELCPYHIIDNAQVFEYEQVQSIEKSLASCKEDITILASQNGSSVSNEDILKDYYKRKYLNGKGIMLMLDIKSKTVTAYSEDKIPEKLENAVKAANELAAKEDYMGAISKVTDAMN